MFEKDLWSEIFQSIKKNKLRTFLTGFSVAWGIFILVMLLASVKGMENGFKNEFNDDASNAIFISPSETTLPHKGFDAGRRIQFTNDDIEYVKETFKGSYQYITPRFVRNTSVRYKNETGNYAVRAVNPDHQYIEKTNISSGRYINENDLKKKSKVVVIGKKIKEEIFNDEDPVGKKLQINDLLFTVVGVFTDKGNEREELYMYSPVSTFQRIYKNTDNINQIVLTYNPDFNFDQAIEFSNYMEVLFKRRFDVHPDDQGAIYFNNYAEQFSNVNSFTAVLKWISVGIGLLILIAGIVGIGNILVFIIKERTKEIGIRKALGARPYQIVKLVLLESVFITFISGFGGLAFATGILSLIGPLIDVPAFSNPEVDTSTVVIATFILIFSGLVAGLLPAINASKVKPIVALRAD